MKEKRIKKRKEERERQKDKNKRKWRNKEWAKMSERERRKWTGEYDNREVENEIRGGIKNRWSSGAAKERRR